MIGIYKIESPSGKIYIGQSWDIDHRISDYKREYCPYQPLLQKSLLKYGGLNHKYDNLIELSKDITQEILDKLEINFIAAFKDLGYEMLNIKEGGKGGKHSQESKSKISEGMKRVRSLEKELGIIRDIGRPNLRYSDEFIEKLKIDYLNLELSTKEIANKYNLSCANLCNIVKRRLPECKRYKNRKNQK